MIPEKAMKFARDFFDRSVWAGCTELSEADVIKALASMGANPNAYLKFTDAGCIGGVIMPLWFAPDVLVATELFWYAEEKGAGAGLREEFETWARGKGARYAQLSCMVNEHEERLRRTLAAQGYTAKEIGLIKEL